VASAFHQGSINVSTGGLFRTAHASAELDQVMTTIEHWLENENYKKRFSNSWKLDTVPEGDTLAYVERFGCVQGWFDRWYVGWTGLSQCTPALEIVCLSSAANSETIVHISSSMGRKDNGTLGAWEPLIESLNTAVESTKPK
jgi:hypothetical protein